MCMNIIFLQHLFKIYRYPPENQILLATFGNKLRPLTYLMKCTYMATMSPDSILNSLYGKEIGKKQLFGISTVLCL